MTTKEKIIDQARKSFALLGLEGVSMRTLAQQVPITPSVLYYHFHSKEDLLNITFFETLNLLRSQIDRHHLHGTAIEMLRERIAFSFDHAWEVVFLLKFFMQHKHKFPLLEQGYVPTNAYWHIIEVIEYGKTLGEFATSNPLFEAKVITHAVNGFLLEYFPDFPQGKDKQKLVDTVYQFSVKALTNRL